MSLVPGQNDSLLASAPRQEGLVLAHYQIGDVIPLLDRARSFTTDLANDDATFLNLMAARLSSPDLSTAKDVLLMRADPATHARALAILTAIRADIEHPSQVSVEVALVRVPSAKFATLSLTQEPLVLKDLGAVTVFLRRVAATRGSVVRRSCDDVPMLGVAVAKLGPKARVAVEPMPDDADAVTLVCSRLRDVEVVDVDVPDSPQPAPPDHAAEETQPADPAPIPPPHLPAPQLPAAKERAVVSLQVGETGVVPLPAPPASAEREVLLVTLKVVAPR